MRKERERCVFLEAFEAIGMRQLSWQSLAYRHTLSFKVGPAHQLNCHLLYEYVNDGTWNTYRQFNKKELDGTQVWIFS